MDISDEAAVWLWELRFGEETAVRDRTGREMLKGDYRKNTGYGWDVYYKFPQKPGGAYRLRDFEIVHIKTYAEKALSEMNVGAKLPGAGYGFSGGDYAAKGSTALPRDRGFIPDDVFSRPAADCKAILRSFAAAVRRLLKDKAAGNR